MLPAGYPSVPGIFAVIPFVVSVRTTSTKTTVIGGVQLGWNAAVAVSVKSAFPFCTGKSPATATPVLLVAFG